MGMTAAFVALAPSKLEFFQANSEQLADFFSQELTSDDAARGVDIDKSWGAIHFLLTGSQWGGEPPNSLPILGGEELGPEFSYGPIRFLTAEEVVAANKVLEVFTLEKLKERYIPQELEDAEIYPSRTWLEEEEENFEYISHYYEQLRAFYSIAAKNGDAVLLTIL